MKKIALALAFAALINMAPIAHARSAVPLVEPERAVFVTGPAALTPTQMRQAIIRGGDRHGWTVDGEEPGKIRLKYIKENRHEVVLDVSYDTTGFLIRYVSSKEMKYEVSDGVAKVHPFYNKWVDNLTRAIQAEAKAAETTVAPAAQ